MYLDAHGAEIEIEEESSGEQTMAQVEAKAPAEPLGRSRPQKTAPSEVAPMRDGLQLYLASIRDIPLLTREQVSELSATIDEQEARFRHAINGLPGAGPLLLERWSARKAASHTTATLAHRYQSDVGHDWASEIDARAGELRELASSRSSQVPAVEATPDQWQSQHASMCKALSRDLDALSTTMREADILLEILIEIHGELAAVAGGKPKSDLDRAAIALGFGRANARARLATATGALELRKDAIQTMASHNLRLVIRSAKRFRHLGLPMLDLIQEGNTGLLRAVEKFDHTKGFTFSTYAVWWIDQALIRGVQAQSRTVRVPGHVHQLQRRSREAEQWLRSRLERDPSLPEIARALEIDPARLERATSSTYPIQSLDEPVADDARTNLVDSLEAPAGEEPCDEMERTRVSEILQGGLDSLDDRERAILELRFGLNGEEPLTLREVGERQGLSRERVRQIEARSLEFLREQADIQTLSLQLGDARAAA